jgi:aldehyde:ferredoxin oxidoreductase
VPIADAPRFKALCQEFTRTYKRDTSLWMRFVRWRTTRRRFMGVRCRGLRQSGRKLQSPERVFRQLWAKRGTTSAFALTIENGDGPIKNWKGVGARDFPLATKSWKLDGPQVDKLITKKLSCGDCPAPCKGIVAHKERKLSDVRRPDFEALAGFGANLLNDDLGVVTACHDACNRYGMDAVSASATLGWVAECVEEGLLSAAELDGVDMRWGDGEAALALTIKMGSGEGCGAWLRNGVKAAAAHVGKGSERFAVQVGGQEPAYHDPRFTSLMGVTYIADPTPGRHTAGSASWNETFAMKYPLPTAVDEKETTIEWHGTQGKGLAQAHYSNAMQTMNGLGLCMFTGLTGGLPWLELTNALTGWGMTEKDLLACGERIQNLRNAFNRREGITPGDVQPHPRMMGEGDGHLTQGPLRGVRVPLLQLRDDYYGAMGWNPATGRLRRERAEQLGLTELLAGYVDA